LFIDGAGEINEVATVRSFIQPLFINGFCLNQKKLLSIANNLYYNMKSLLLFLMFLPFCLCNCYCKPGIFVESCRHGAV